MLYLGIDPSFTKTGLCLLDTTSKKIVVDFVSPSGTNDDYREIVRRMSSIRDGIDDIVGRHCCGGIDNMCAVIEEPLSSSMKASRLGMLSGFLIANMIPDQRLGNIYTVDPAYIAWLVRPYAKKHKIGNKKTASRVVANLIINYLGNEFGYSLSILNSKLDKKGNPKKRIMSHDEGEAFILVFTMMRHMGVFEDVTGLNKFLCNISNNFLNDPKIRLLK